VLAAVEAGVAAFSQQLVDGVRSLAVRQEVHVDRCTRAPVRSQGEAADQGVFDAFLVERIVDLEEDGAKIHWPGFGHLGDPRDTWGSLAWEADPRWVGFRRKRSPEGSVS